MTRAGVGKTYLAAFDSKNYERVLFVAHREEILKQAAESFKNVRDSDDYGFFNGDSKCTEKSVIFASVAVIIVTICLACLMKAKAEGDRIYDELAYKHFSSKEERKGEQTERYG